MGALSTTVSTLPKLTANAPANGSLERFVSFRGWLPGRCYGNFRECKASGKIVQRNWRKLSCEKFCSAGFWAVENCAPMKRSKIAVPKPLSLKPLQ